MKIGYKLPKVNHFSELNVNVIDVPIAQKSMINTLSVSSSVLGSSTSAPFTSIFGTSAYNTKSSLLSNIPLASVVEIIFF